MGPARSFLVSSLVAALAVGSAVAEPPTDWVEESDRHTALVTEYFARYLPELMSRLGVESANESVSQLPLDLNERSWAEGRELAGELRARLESADHPAVEQDLRILLQVLEEALAKSQAEAAAIQAATIRWPQLLGEAAAFGEIILPMTYEGGEGLEYDDFTHAAAAWSLVVHEGRPGHELQLASMNERGVSKARAFFAFNSTNVEGWALYAEAEMKPYLPLDGQLVSLQHRLLRAARAFLDPGLQRREIGIEEARRLLIQEAGLSRALAEQEIERYTTEDPGQATSYFCGYARLLELRADAERKLGERFDRRAFNDFLVGQGLVPPALLRRAVMEEFVPLALSESPEMDG
jgi:hypothetical protein